MSQDKPAGLWSQDEIIQPDALARALSDNKQSDTRPVLIQVGIVHLFRMGHIPGSKYAGPANTPEGIELLKKELQSVDRSRELVLYCGCCPWEHCPNMKPSYAMAREMGFKHIKLLSLPKSFLEDWASKGLPVEKSAA